jgi:hypothetical protein
MRDSTGVLDALVQGSTVDLFHSYQVAVAPIARVRAGFVLTQVLDFVGVISFSSPSFTGRLVLAVPHGVPALMKAEVGSYSTARDWTRELTNQLMGRLKNRLSQFQVVLQVGLPSIFDRKHFARQLSQTEGAAIYRFRTLAGEFVVVIDGTCDEALFVYSGARNGAKEGDIILF